MRDGQTERAGTVSGLKARARRNKKTARENAVGIARLFRRARRTLKKDDFTSEDRRRRVVIVSETLAHQVFGGRDPINRTLFWSDPIAEFIGLNTEPRRSWASCQISTMSILPQPIMAVYIRSTRSGGRPCSCTRS